jgi:micrococcal nuclease
MRRFRRYPAWSVWLVLVLCATVAARYLWERRGSAAPHAAEGSSLFGKLVPGPFEVVRVERADLIIIRQRVAVLGNNTPQILDLPVQLLGVKALLPLEPGTEFTRAILSSGSPSLDLDRRRIDNAGHFLAYVYVDGELLNQEVIRAGFGQAELYPGDNQTIHKNLVKAEKEAKDARRGIWASPMSQ